MKLLTLKQIQEEYGVGIRIAKKWALAVGTTPRAKNCKIYVSKEALDDYLANEG